MTTPATIPRAAPPRPSQDYAALRETAMAQIQGLAAETWTDHNHHDPGITLMEAFCYAMTEVGLKLDLDIADLIASGTPQEAPSLPPAPAVLPCAPVTAEDLERQLLDHYLVANARVSTGAADPVAYYHDATSTPPLAYVLPPGAQTRRILPSGLFHVRVAFRDAALNANTYSVTVSVGPDTFALELALPHWDEPEAAPFVAGDATLNGVSMQPPANPWSQMEDSDAYYGRAQIAFTGPGGASTSDVWMVMRIVSGPDVPATVLPAVLAAAQNAVEAAGPASMIQQFMTRVALARTAAQTVATDLLSWRNLGESAINIAVNRVQDIGINARIEVARTTGLEEMLARILHGIDRGLAQPNRFVDPASLRAAGVGNDAILEGPMLSHGHLATPEDEPLVRGDTVFVSDILNHLMRNHADPGAEPGPENPLGRDVVAVTELSLSNFSNNRAITTAATQCLHLVEIDRHQPRLSVPNCRIVLVRDDVEIPYDAARVAALVDAARAEAEATARLPEYDPAPPVLPGTAYDVAAYYPFQYDLPAVFGVSEAGLPGNASVTQRQQARQLRAYLMLMEQLLSDATLQLSHINSLFSPDAAQRQTYFTRPLFEFPDMEALVQHDQAQPWDAFVADPDNSYATALRTSAETPQTATDRRNRMLDHLLARHSEEMVTWGQEAHRWGQRQLLGSTLPPATLPQRIEDRRLAVNETLIGDKAAYLADLPRLHALRAQAFGDPAQWNAGLITLGQQGTQYTWTLVVDGVALMEGVQPVPTQGEAVARARQALRLSGRAAFYGAVDFGGPSNRRFVLRDGPAVTDTVIARGVTGLPNMAAANAAAQPVRNALRTRLRRDSRTAMERRVDHQTGLRPNGHHALLTALSDHFEIIDDAPPAPFVKSWRLRRDEGPAGPVLLRSAGQFTDPLEPAAIAQANADIETALTFALDPWNWDITEQAPASFVLSLRDADANTLATSAAPFATRAEAEDARRTLLDLLYPLFSREGFHSVETLLLRPLTAGDPFLNIPQDEGPSLEDPYSHRILFVLPSGFARDFSAAAPAPVPARPHRFRDAEFRRHMERMIRRSCPAHILPQIHWVDTQAPGTPDNDASFDRFEARYRNWLDTQIMPGAAPAQVTGARNGLITSLNAIMAG